MIKGSKHVAIGLATTTFALTAAVAEASSHREAPGITETPKIDGTDFYMFRSYEPGRENFVTLIANYQPLQLPYGGPNYYTMDPDAIYEIHIDNDGDAVENMTFQFKFDNNLRNDTGITLNVGGIELPIALRAAGQVRRGDNAALGELETYTVTKIAGDRRSGNRSQLTKSSGGESFTKPLDNIGNKTLPDYRAYAGQYIYDVSIPGCSAPGRVFVGQRAEAFAVNLGETFDLVNYVPLEGDSQPGAGDGGGFPGGITQSRDNDDLIGQHNVTTIALEAPISCLTGNGNGVIGGWTTASLPQASLEDPSPTYESTALYGGAYVQQSRLSAPLVNEVVIGLPDKDLFNAAEPMGDAALADYVTNPTFPAILDLLFRDAVNSTLGTNIDNLAPTNFPRNDLVAAFLTGFEGVNQQATVTPSEMLRLNTDIPATPRADQSAFGIVGDDLAGFPNGRRPGDDVVDITLRVAMGRLCYPIPVNGNATNLGLCAPEDAPVGNQPFTDGAPLNAGLLQETFPYLNTPIPGSPDEAREPNP